MYLKDSLVLAHKLSLPSLTGSGIELISSSTYLQSEIEIIPVYTLKTEMISKPSTLLINSNLLQREPHVFIICLAFF